MIDGVIDKSDSRYIKLVSYMEDKEWNSFIEDAIYTFIDRTHLTAFEPKHYRVISMIAEYLFNRNGTLGSTSESHSQSSYQYTEDLPKEIMNSLRTYRVIPK